MNLKEEIIELLNDQKEIFGNDLYTSVKLSEFKYKNIVESKEEVPARKIQKVEEVPTISQFEKITNLNDFDSTINNCKMCELSETRNKFVFGAGNSNADLMIIGEAPGAEEDKEGIPFVGKAGKLLNDILIAIGFNRDDVFIANILKCRPPNNRDPLPSERKLCKPYLYKQIDLIKPKVILLLGKVAANVMLNNNESLTKMRGSEHMINEIRTMVTYHPAALLRNSNWKRPTWEDVQKVKKLYDELMEN